MNAKKSSHPSIATTCPLLAIPAQDPFRVFDPPVAPPFPITTDAAFDWAAWENAKEEKLITSTTTAAAEFMDGAGVELIAAHAGSPLERRKVPFPHLARLHDLTVLQDVRKQKLDGPPEIGAEHPRKA